jgi:peptidase E
VTGRILPMGAGRAILDRRDDPLHRLTLELTGAADPRIVFLGTATGDDPAHIVSFYETYTALGCRPAHLRLFTREVDDLRSYLLGFDVIHVGGGNTAALLDVWRRQGVDAILREAWEAGAILTGGSAGGICWFEGGTTDSFGPTLRPLRDGLGLLAGSFCPHYDVDDQRRPLFHAAVRDGALPPGYAADDRVMLRFDGTTYVGAVSSHPAAAAYRVAVVDGRLVEEPLEVERLPVRP